MSRTGRVPVLVFGTGLTALGVIRALGRRRIPAFVADPSQGGVRWSRWYRRISAGVPDRPSGPALDEYLHGLDVDQAVLIGCSDDWARCLAERPRHAGDRFVTSLPEADAIATLVDKRGLATALQDADVPHPETRPVEAESDLDVIAHAPPNSYFLKPTDSQRFGPVFDAKAFNVVSRDDAVAKFRKARDAGLEMLLQEYVPGPPTNHHFLDGFIDAQGTLRALFARRRFRMYPRDFGNSSYMASVAPEAVGQATESIHRLLSHVAYRGMFSAEFKRDQRSGVFKLLEVNVRPWWYVEFAARCGVDVCYMYYLDALGLPVPSALQYRVGQRLVHAWCDYKAWFERRRAGDAAWWDHWSAWIGSHRATFAWDDPLPAVVETTRSVVRKVTRRDR